MCPRLESTALLLADQLNAHQALVIAETLEEMQSRNFQLINKYEFHPQFSWLYGIEKN